MVDSDNDHSFADESSMTDYKVNHDIGHFGHDNPATPVSESVPFVSRPIQRRTRTLASASSRAPTAPT